jgi:hypothetical protein
MLTSSDGREWPDITPQAGPRSGWHARKFIRIGHATIPKESRTSLYGVYGVRNDGSEIFTQYEGYEEDGVITGRPIVVSDSDSDPYIWSAVTWFSETRIFDQVFTDGEYKPIGQIIEEAETNDHLLCL